MCVSETTLSRVADACSRTIACGSKTCPWALYSSMKRHYLTRGAEHQVFLARFHPKTILKSPRLITRVSRWLFGGVAGVRQEYQAAQALVRGSAVAVARTRIVAVGRHGAYILIQEEVHEDHSVPDIYAYLQQQQQAYLAHRYLTNPRNFMSQDGVVYLIDFTKGIDLQLINRMQIISEMEYRKVRRCLRQVIRSTCEQVLTMVAGGCAGAQPLLRSTGRYDRRAVQAGRGAVRV